MTYRVAKTEDGRILVEEPPTFVASFAGGHWLFKNLFGLADELKDVSDPIEAEKFYQEAKRAARVTSAKTFYRAMYGGAQPDIAEFTVPADDDDSDDEPPPDFAGVRL